MQNNTFYPMRNERGINGLRDLISYINQFQPVNELIMVEIGSYIGESTVVFADAFKQVISVDPYVDNYDPTDHACKQAPFEMVYKQFLFNTKSFHNITHIRKTSDQAIKHLAIESVDFVYIDGNHQYDFVKKDIESYFKIIKPNGFLGGHDYPYKPVQDAIKDTISTVDQVFNDRSWIKRKVA